MATERSERSATSGRFRPLDGLRGLAALSVVAFHAGFAHASGGELGVDLFFALSGYLITGLLLNDVARTGAIRLLRFWARRTLRLLPPLLAVLVVSAFIAKDMSPTGRAHDFFPDAAIAGTWSMDVLSIFEPSRNSTRPLFYTWTLSIEEQFYLVWPLILALLLRRERLRHHLPALLIAAGLLSWLDLALLWPSHSTGVPSIYARPDSRSLPLLLGCALAVALRREVRGTVLRGLATPLGGLAAGFLTFGGLVLPGALDWKTSAHTFVMVGSLATSVGGAALVGFLVQRPQSPISRVLASRPLVALGAISYSLYLAQIPAIRFIAFRGWLPAAGWSRWMSALGAALVGAVVLWAAVERPCLRWLRRTTAVPEPLAITAAAPTGAVRPLPATGAGPRRRVKAWAAVGLVPAAFVALGGIASAALSRHDDLTPASPRPTPTQLPSGASGPDAYGQPSAPVSGAARPTTRVGAPADGHGTPRPAFAVVTPSTRGPASVSTALPLPGGATVAVPVPVTTPTLTVPPVGLPAIPSAVPPTHLPTH